MMVIVWLKLWAHFSWKSTLMNLAVCQIFSGPTSFAKGCSKNTVVSKWFIQSVSKWWASKIRLNCSSSTVWDRDMIFTELAPRLIQSSNHNVRHSVCMFSPSLLNLFEASHWPTGHMTRSKASHWSAPPNALPIPMPPPLPLAPKRSKMLLNVPQCSQMLWNALKCSEMLWNAAKGPKWPRSY